MKLMTKEIANRLPRLYQTQGNPDPVAIVKFFTPWGNWTWYATEWDGDGVCFGLVDGHEKEIGYFDLNEMAAVRGPFGLGIERDLHFKPTPLSQLGYPVYVETPEVPAAPTPH